MFEDRQHAGILLAHLLAKYKSENPIIFALPRGGVAIGAEIAKALNLPLEIVIAKKIGHPHNPEMAIAAISESGCIAENEVETQKVDERWLERAFEIEKEESERRRVEYLNHPIPPLHDKTVIITDDGLATGLTLKAAIKELKQYGPKQIIIAVPVAPAEATVEFKKYCNDIVVVNSDKHFQGSVGAYYKKFPQLTDLDVDKLLKATR